MCPDGGLELRSRLGGRQPVPQVVDLPMQAPDIRHPRAKLLDHPVRHG